MSEEAATGPPVIHATALCESSDVGQGTRIWAFAHVMPRAVVGSGCNLCDHTYVDDGARLGDFVTLKNGVSVWDQVTLESDVFVAAGVAFTNDRVPRARPHRTPPQGYLPTLVRQGAVLGANATIVCGVTIGCHSLIGAGAVVTRDVADHAVVMGVPAQQVGWICKCGERLNNELACVCGRVFQTVPATGQIASIYLPGHNGSYVADSKDVNFTTAKA